MSVIAAGVLLYNRNHGFLLGRETSNRMFGAFAGAREKDETIVECASREFYEETMGLIMDMETSRRILRDTKYYEVPIEHGHFFRLYLLEIPYNKDIISEFKKRYTQLKRLNMSGEFLEKDEAKWVNMTKLLKAIDEKCKLKLRPDFIRAMKFIF